MIPASAPNDPPVLAVLGVVPIVAAAVSAGANPFRDKLL
jgi:hypothetical protein